MFWTVHKYQSTNHYKTHNVLKKVNSSSKILSAQYLHVLRSNGVTGFVYLPFSISKGNEPLQKFDRILLSTTYIISLETRASRLFYTIHMFLICYHLVCSYHYITVHSFSFISNSIFLICTSFSFDIMIIWINYSTYHL